MRRLTALVLLSATLLGAGCKDLFAPMKIELPKICGMTYAGPECGFLSPPAPTPAGPRADSTQRNASGKARTGRIAEPLPIHPRIS